MSDELKVISRIVPPYPFEAYAHIISPLSAKDGCGYLITFPDIPGCMSDGETEAEAVVNGRDAFVAVISALHDWGVIFPYLHFKLFVIIEQSTK